MTPGSYRTTCLVGLIVVFPMLLARCGGDRGDASATAAIAEGQVIPPGGASDGLVVAFGTQPDPLAKGDNAVQVTVKRGDGSPVTGADVQAIFSMAAMPSMNMPAMRSQVMLQHEGEGRYRGTSQLPMGGAWNVAVTVSQGSNVLATRRLGVVATE